MNRSWLLSLVALITFGPGAAGADPFALQETCGNSIGMEFDANIPLVGADLPGREMVMADACISGSTDLDLNREGFFEGTQLRFDFLTDPTFTFDLVLDGQDEPVVTIDALVSDFSFLFEQRGAATPSEPGSAQIPGEFTAMGLADFEYSGPLAGEIGPVFDQFLTNLGGSPTFDLSLLDFNEQSIFLLETSHDPTTPVWDLFMNIAISGAFPEDVPALIADLSITPIDRPTLRPIPEPASVLLVAAGLAGLAWRARRGR